MIRFLKHGFQAVLILCCLSTLQISVSFAQPEGFTKLEIGVAAPNFDLPGVDDKNHKLEDFAGSDVLMVVFTCNHCPTAQAYESRLKQIYEDYHQRGVALVAISPNDPQAVRLDELGYSDLGDSLEEMKIRATDAGFKFPYLFDGETQKTSLAFGVIATPHVFIFDRQRKLRYKGRIDDSDVKTVTSSDARNALDALLRGQKVPIEVTKVFGCSTKWSSKRALAQKSIEKWDREPVELSLIDANGLKEISANTTDKYRLVSVWATWCAPCVDELPEFVTINRMFRKRDFEVITVSADDAESKDKALKVLVENHVSTRNVLFNSDSRDALFEGLDPKWEGGLPYTVLIAPGGEIVYRNHDSIAPKELKCKIADCLGRTYVNRKPKPKKVKSATQSNKKIKVGANFKTGELVAWCIVPFDAKNRGPAERAKMIRELGLRRVAYDWRPNNLPEFEQEIIEYKKNEVEYFAFWKWHDSMEPLIRKHGIKPQIWQNFSGPAPQGTNQEKIEQVIDQFLPIAQKAKSLGLKFGIYNHGGWHGEPENLVSICRRMRENHNLENVGIVYNFHHAHEHLDRFAKKFETMKPYLLCVNLNGMADPATFDEKTKQNKILPIGSGVHEKTLIQTIVASGYTGPIGVLGYRKELDAKQAVQLNLDLLDTIVDAK